MKLQVNQTIENITVSGTISKTTTEAVTENVTETTTDEDAFELNEFKQLKLLNDLCYKEGTLNIIPNKLIEKVFDYYTFYEMECVSQKEDSFKKKLMFDYKKNC